MRAPAGDRHALPMLSPSNKASEDMIVHYRDAKNGIRGAGMTMGGDKQLSGVPSKPLERPSAL